METTELSKYQISWVELKATKGIATKHDCEKLHAARMKNGCIYSHFANASSAIAYIESLKDVKLDKIYECRIFTDMQFGNWDIEHEEHPAFTSMQNSNVLYTR